MQLKEEHIKDKKIVGHTGDGRPIVLCETHGGLFAFFTKGKDGGIETLAAAPHKGIGSFMVEQKDHDVKWNDKLDETVKSTAADLFESLRKRFLSQECSMSKSECNTYVHYDYQEGTFEILDKSEIKDLDKWSPIRKSDFSAPMIFAGDYYE